MPIFFIASLAAQIFCGYHVVKTGQDKYWLYLIILAPGIGCLVYALAIMLPSMSKSHQGKKTIRAIQKTIDPRRNIRALQDELTLRDTPQLREHLGNEYFALEQYDEAIAEYKKSLVGPNQGNPDTLLKLAHAYFDNGAYDQCLQSLTTLLELNPSYESQEGHLLQAQAQQQKGDFRAAEATYKQVTGYYSGPQAHLCYAKMLHEQQRYKDAKTQLDEILSYARIAPKHYKRFHKECLAEAKKLLDSLPQ
ncbi:MAG: tetratricopeptide repeat protein [Saezia sp.]